MRREMGMRARVISALDKVGALEMAMRVRKHVRLPYLPILTYHRLGDPARDARELDEGVVDATREMFDRHVALLVKRFSVIGIDDLTRFFVEGQPLPKNPALITFDDGYKACHDLALPILQKYGTKATFFISTGHLADRTVFWWDRVNYLLKKSTKTRFTVEWPSHVEYDFSRDRDQVFHDVLEVIKATDHLDVERYLQELSRALDVPWTAAEEKRITDDVLMTWDEVRALHKAGMDIESHTHTHRVLTTLNDEELADECARSKKVLEEQISAPVRAIAYPVRLGPKRHREVFDAAKNAGYTLGFSGSSHLSPFGRDTDRFDIQRIHVDPSLPESYFRASIAVPQLAFWRG